MNDTYKRLANEAADYCSEQADGSAWTWERKFAELLIEDCLKVLESHNPPPTIDFTVGWNAAVEMKLIAMRAHFGMLE